MLHSKTAAGAGPRGKGGAAAMTASRGKTRDMAQTALFAVVIAVCAWISVPTAVPFTMQTFGVFLAMGVLGGKRGTLAVCVYLLLGLAGVPVFAGGTAGVGVLMGATGGYLLAWVFAGLAVWGMEAALGRKTWVLALEVMHWNCSKRTWK